MTSKLVLLLVFLLSFSLLAGEAVKDDPQAVCRASVDAAKKMLEIKQAEAAKALLDAALKAVPTDVEALFLRARIRLNENDLAGASADAEEGRKSLYRKGSSNWTKMESEMFNESGTIIDRSDVINKAKKEIETIKANLRKMGNETSDEVWKKKIITFSESITYQKEETITKTAPITSTTKKEETKITDPIVGKWKWPNGSIVILADDGKANAIGLSEGKWVKQDDAYKVQWNVNGAIRIFSMENLNTLKFVDTNKPAIRIKDAQ